MDGEPLKQITYVSTATMPFSKDDLTVLMRHARRKNKQHGVTGLLLVQLPVFLQVLEGPPVAVDKIMEDIRKDSRHSDIEIVHSNESLQDREFGQWLMGCKILGDGLPEEFSQLDARVKQVLRGARADSAAAQQLLRDFREIESRHVDI